MEQGYSVGAPGGVDGGFGGVDAEDDISVGPTGPSSSSTSLSAFGAGTLVGVQGPGVEGSGSWG